MSPAKAQPSPPTNDVSSRPKKGFLKRCIPWIAAFLLLGALAWLFHRPLMSGAARAWIVDDPVVKADAVVVLGGGLEWRPFAAAEMYRKGLAPVVLVADVRKKRYASLGEYPDDYEITLRILRQEGVPASAIQRIGHQVANSHDEAVALHDWIRSHPSHVVAIPTDPFPTRRTKSFFVRELRTAGVDLRVYSVPNPDYDATKWWESEAGLISFQNEVVKFLYYRTHY